MTDNVCEANIERYRVGYWSDEDTPFCLAQLANYETENKDQTEKVDKLLEGRFDQDAIDFTQVCNIGKCSLRIIRNETVGRRVDGACRAVSFCLKERFELVGELPLDEARIVYKDIVETLEGHMDKNNAGNYCPKLNCGLSAGVSIDGNPGTAGICLEKDQSQTKLSYE